MLYGFNSKVTECMDLDQLAIQTNLNGFGIFFQPHKIVLTR